MYTMYWAAVYHISKHNWTTFSQLDEKQKLISIFQFFLSGCSNRLLREWAQPSTFTHVHSFDHRPHLTADHMLGSNYFTIIALMHFLCWWEICKLAAFLRLLFFVQYRTKPTRAQLVRWRVSAWMDSHYSVALLSFEWRRSRSWTEMGFLSF